MTFKHSVGSLNTPKQLAMGRKGKERPTEEEEQTRKKGQKEWELTKSVSKVNHIAMGTAQSKHARGANSRAKRCNYQ